jgi:bifunctional non-homologous end joining protein LigD
MTEQLAGSPVTHVSPMLAVPGPPPEGDDWAYEFLWEGLRVVCQVRDRELRVVTREGQDVTAGYPELAVLVDRVGGRSVVLDGHLVTLDAHGVPDLAALRPRLRVPVPSIGLRLGVPVHFHVFDLLALDDRPTLLLDYLDRRALLIDLDLADGAVVRVPPHVMGLDGHSMLRVAAARGLPGVVAKRYSSPYRPGRRSPDWVRVVVRQVQTVVVGGWRAAGGGVAALLLGVRDPAGALVYVGEASTRLAERTLDEVRARLVRSAQSVSPFAGSLPRDQVRDAHWVRPDLVGVVEFRGWTGERRLRDAAWRGPRADLGPEHAIFPDSEQPR